MLTPCCPTFACRFFGGELVFKGSFPSLVSLEEYSFMTASQDADIAADVVIGSHMPRLAVVGKYAFKNLKGSLRFSGAFPALREIGEYAFRKINSVMQPGVLNILCHAPGGLTVGTGALEYFLPT